MFHWTFVFLVLGLIAGFFGFTDIAGAPIGLAKILFVVFVAVFIIMLLVNMVLRGPEPPKERRRWF